MIQNKMDFSMLMNRIFSFLTLVATLAGCATQQAPETNWSDIYGTLETSTPSQMQYGRYSDDGETVHRMAVMLPLTGDTSAVGRTIRTSVEAAVLKSAPQNLSVAFYDTSKDINTTIDTVLATNPEIIIGPVFASDTRALRDKKPESLPAISFTSDATAVGNGVMTMALLPTNSVEAIIREMQSDGIKQFIIIAPDTKSGRLMAGTAVDASEIYNLPLAGIFYYTEKDTDSIKNTTISASMNVARAAAHTRARTVLSDIITNERLTMIERSNLTRQLEKLDKSETLGTVPYDAILFLGNGDDTRTLVSFLRYYDISARDVKMYGTALWDNAGLESDITLSGAKFAILPESNAEYTALYEQISGAPASRLATIGYDATNLAIGMLYSDKSVPAYLLDPSGYIGTDGLFRLKPAGDNERAMRIVQLNGSGELTTTKNAAENFMSPLYNIEQRHIKPADNMPLQTDGIDPDNYIVLPERLREKYGSKTVGANQTGARSIQKSQLVAILPTDTDTTIIQSNYTPVKLEPVQQTYIDEVEIYE